MSAVFQTYLDIMDMEVCVSQYIVEGYTREPCYNVSWGKLVMAYKQYMLWFSYDEYQLNNFSTTCEIWH